MTAQIEDRFYYRDQEFDVVGIQGEEFFNPFDFGICVYGVSTACYRGFVAEFSVDNENRLILRGLEANVVNCKTELGRNIYEGTRLVLTLQRTLNENNDEESEETRRLKTEIERLHKAIPTFEDRNEYYRNLLASAPDEAPTLNGVAAVCSDSAYNHCRMIYENIAEPIQFTGSLLIGADFDNKFYVHMGFQEPIGYKNLWELDFKNGVLEKAVDRSKAAARARGAQGNCGLGILDRAKGDGMKAVVDAIDDSFDLASDSKWSFLNG